MNDSAMNLAIQQIPTPFYLFDEASLNDKVAHIRALLPRKTLLCYAMKANPFMVKQAARLVERVEVCSPGELRICQMLGIPDSQLVISGVHKDSALLEELIENHPKVARYTVESIAQFDLMQNIAKQQEHEVRVLVRITSGNQFGMSEGDATSVIKRCIDDPFMECAGIQFFSGTQKTSLKRLRSELEYLDRLMAKLAFVTDAELEELEYGPGLPALYFEDGQNAESQEDALSAELADVLESMRFKGRAILELGRSLTADCGCYATRIVDMKANYTGRYAIVDGGRHQIAYYGNSLAMKQPPCHLYGDEREDEPEAWNICGSLCTVNDILAKQMTFRGLRLGDILVFERVGAYSMTEGLSLFLSRDLPSVVMVDEGGNLQIVRERTETSPLNMSSSLL